MQLAWKKLGCPRCVCIGIRSTQTGVLRPLTDVDVERIKLDVTKFGLDKGAVLEEPFTVLP